MKRVFSQTKQLLKQSWDVLKGDKNLLLIPIIPILLATGFVIIALYFFLSTLKAERLETSLLILLFSLIALLVIFTLGTFFNIVLFSCVNDRFNGREISLKKGFSVAIKNFKKVIAWAAINTGAYTAFSEVSRGTGVKITTEAGRVTWKMATTFVVPVMIFEDKRITEAVARSVYLFTKTWGQTVVGRFSLGLFLFINALVSAGLGFILTYSYLEFLAFQTLVPIAILWALLIAYVILVGLVTSVLGGIFKIALYHYASTGQIPSGFSEGTIKNAYSAYSVEN